MLRDTCELVRHRVVIRSEHHAERGCHDIEHAVFVGQGFGVIDVVLDGQSLLRGQCTRGRNQRLGKVAGRDDKASAGRRPSQFTGASGDVEKVKPRVEV